MSTPTHRGLFLVIDGADGSGKATQTTLLVEHLRRLGRRVETVSFPQYGKPSAHAVEQYLGGFYGDVHEVSPYRSSLFFALDRHDAAPQIRTWINDGAMVIADRYVSSNMGHQACKITDASERRRYLLWNEEFEYEILQLPRPDMTVVLHMPPESARHLAAQASTERYKVANDIHERSLEHLSRAAETYRELVTLFPNFVSVECTDASGILRSADDVHKEIRQHVERHPALTSTITLEPTNVSV